MTNAEKFEQVFGVKVDEDAPDPCDIFDRSFCNNTDACCGCRAQFFWDDEYEEVKK